ncbi:MAG TPA: ORF6N domain-containing protein [Candidatus Eremiobacteraceae bacterium]|nr:ORF6N domain-containing protein [Candidatus Eremiobacteraceae bacterium]
MTKSNALVPIERIESLIFLIRGHKVMIDADLAELYGVTTKRLNEQVKRNKGRFPRDFMFQLTAKEKAEVVANCDHLQKLKFSSALPYAFTEHGAVMLASVLNSPVAVEASIQVVRAFVKLREILGTHRKLAVKLMELESRMQGHDDDITALFEAIRQLMEPSDKPARRIGFHT